MTVSIRPSLMSLVRASMDSGKLTEDIYELPFVAQQVAVNEHWLTLNLPVFWLLLMRFSQLTVVHYARLVRIWLI